MEEENFCCEEKDNRHSRIKRGDKFKKRDNVRESVVREEKSYLRAEQSNKDRGIVDQSDMNNIMETKKKIKKGTSSRLTKEQKRQIYEQEELLVQKPKKGKKQVQLSRSRDQ